MASSSEVGHTKNVANFESLISYCTGFGAVYNPSNTNLNLTALTALHTESKVTLKSVKTTKATFDEIEGERKVLFKPLKPLSTKMLGALKSSGAASTVIDDAKTINNKIQGRRANIGSATPTTNAETKDTISASQQSYDLQIDHFEKLIELLTTEPKFNPNETPLKLVTLTTYKTKLETANTAVKNAYTPYSNAMIARDIKLYNPENGLVERSKLVKNYVKSIFGASSPEYKQINKLRFKSIA
jgi:hypothetical protein